MLEHTQDILKDLDALLDNGDIEAAGKLLTQVDPTSLRALLLHLMHERGSDLTDEVGRAYLRERDQAA